MDFNDFNENNNKNFENAARHGFRPSLTLSFSVLILGLILLLTAAYVGGSRHQSVQKSQNIENDITETNNEDTTSQIKSESESDSEKAASANTDGDIENAFFYIARTDENGNVAIYLQSGKLYRCLNVPAFTLSDFDRERLKEGIAIRDDSELSDLIEDILG